MYTKASRISCYHRWQNPKVGGARREGGLGLGYEWNGEAYERHAEYQFRTGRELLASLDPQDGESILDVGCGNGLLTLEIAERIPSGTVLGIDSSSSMLAQAEVNRQRRGGGNLTFRQLDALELGFNGEFDAIYSNAVLHWIGDQVRLLGQLRRALKANGRLSIGLGGRGNAKSLYELLDGMIKSQSYRDFFTDWEFPWYLPDEGTYRSLLAEAGFSDIRIETRRIPVAFDPEGFRGWLTTTQMPYLGRIPAERREAFAAEVTAGYRELSGTDELTVPFVRLLVQARR